MATNTSAHTHKPIHTKKNAAAPPLFPPPLTFPLPPRHRSMLLARFASMPRPAAAR